jgi:hypothetical protein
LRRINVAIKKVIRGVDTCGHVADRRMWRGGVVKDIFVKELDGEEGNEENK